MIEPIDVDDPPIDVDEVWDEIVQDAQNSDWG